MSSTEQPYTWNVVSQMQTMEPGFNNQITRGVRVYYKTSVGADGSVFVPEAQYGDVERVREIVAAAVAQTVAVHQLQG